MGHVQKGILPAERSRSLSAMCLSPSKECLCQIITCVKALKHTKPLWLVIYVTKKNKPAASKYLPQANGTLTFSKLSNQPDNLVEIVMYLNPCILHFEPNPIHGEINS